MKWLFITLIAMQSLLRDDFEHRLGIVLTDQNQTCLAINNEQLKPGTRVYVTALTAPVATYTGLVATPAPGCTRVGGYSNVYSLTFPSSRRPPELAGAAIGVFATISDGGVVRFRLTPAPTRHLLEFRACTSANGSTISVLTSAPGSNGVVWSHDVERIVPGAPPCDR